MEKCDLSPTVVPALLECSAQPALAEIGGRNAEPTPDGQSEDGNDSVTKQNKGGESRRSGKTTDKVVARNKLSRKRRVSGKKPARLFFPGLSLY